MNTGISLKNVKGATISNNTVTGYSTAVDIENSEDIKIDDNTIISRKIQDTYGAEINDVLAVIKDKKDAELINAFKHIQNSSPENAVDSWIVIIKKLGPKIGNFSADILKGVFSTAVYSLFKLGLSKIGILIP